MNNIIYSDVRQRIVKKQRDVRMSMYQPPSVDDLEFMINELISDGELSVDEYLRLNSELKYLKTKN